MSRPLVSVLLPVRNAEGTVRAAIRSILDGTLRDLELLAVDDGSTDGTGAVLAALAAEDRRVRVLSTRGLGLVGALNLGWKEAEAPYLARMDADDEALPERLAASVTALMAEPALAGVGTGVELFREDRPVSPALLKYAAWLNSLTSPEALRLNRFVESPLCHPSVCLRRERVAALGGFAAGDFPEDYALWLALLDQGHALMNLPRVLLRWRDHDGRLTRKDPRYALRRFTFLKARYLSRTPALRQGPCAVVGTGPEGLALMRFLKAEGARVAWLVDVNPRKVGTQLEGLAVRHPDTLQGPGAEHLVLAVGAHGARDELRAFLSARGYVEGVHFTCAA